MMRLGMACLVMLMSMTWAGCASTPSPGARHSLAQAVADQGGLRLTLLPTQPPVMAALSLQPDAVDNLTVYIEGDGLAWRTAQWPSTDPTPTDPIALRMAVQHKPGAAAWLSRPCQYIDAESSHCPSSQWTSERYGPATTALMSQALDLLKVRHQAQKLVLVGYSGGGTMAAILASRRTDVVSLVTVAANMDLDHWTSHHGLPLMRQSENPAALSDTRLKTLPQVHFVGTLDTVVPPDTVRSYAKKLRASHLKMVVMAQGDHHCCWSNWWAQLLASVNASP